MQSPDDKKKPCCGGHRKEEPPVVPEEKAGCCSGHHSHDAAGPKEAPAGSATGWYICPMCPSVRQDHPGDCPICGMALEPERMSLGPEDTTELDDMTRRFWIAAALTLPVFVLGMAHGWHVPGSGWIQWALSTPVVFWAGGPFFRKAWKSIVTRHFNMFTLIALGVGAAYLFSTAQLLMPDLFPAEVRGHYYFESAAVITVLVLLGQVLELRARRRTSHAIRELLSLAPETARRLTPDGEEIIPVEAVQVGDRLRVRPGDRIAVDGVLVEGASYIDEAMLTGEAHPQRKEVGGKVSAGTVNGEGAFIMTAQHVGSDTVLSRIVEMVGQAQRSRAPIQNLVDKVAGYFVPAVVAVSALAFAAWMVWGPEPKLAYALVSAISVLVIACPCALGLATPMSIMVGVGRGAKTGVLIKDAAALQRLEEVDTIVVDKTGTLTEGKPEVCGSVTGTGVSEKELLEVAASLEVHSEHPLGSAVVRAAREHGVAMEEVSDFQNISGKGIRARWPGGEEVRVGKAAFLHEMGIVVPAEGETGEVVNGRTRVHVGRGSRWLGVLAIDDPIKETTPAAVKALLEMGLHVVMLTGDSPSVAAKVAGELGIREYEAHVLPEDKFERVKALQAQGRRVAMAGDGINDAPALAQADVGIAMSTGTDVAIESAGVTLMHGDLGGIVRAVKLSRGVLANIRQNLVFAFIYNILGVPVAAGVLYPALGLLLSPMIAGAAMSFSSVSVILNALRLRRVKIDT